MLRQGLSRWKRDADRLEELRRDGEARAARAAEQRRDAEDLRAQHTELLTSVGADVTALHRRLAEVEAQSQRATDRRGQADQLIKSLGERRGAARADVDNATDRQREQQPLVTSAALSLAEVADVPGLLQSVAWQVEPTDDGSGPAAAAADDPAETQALGGSWLDHASATLHTAAGIREGDPIPRAVSRLARVLASLPGDEPPDADAVYRALLDVQAGPGGDREPRVVPVGALLAVLGRDDAGEHPIGELASRLDAQVVQDRALLTERERRLFEEHVLGGLGDALRERRQEAAELVEAMNLLLGEVSTSQGIRVRLQWTLRDDIASDARQAVRLLGQPTGALLPDERAALRDALHRLIDQSRTQAPEESYTEHLSRALDYRHWFAFRIKYSRPEVDGWIDLTRRSALSQGEQKVVCYLPLFAAAAAHFSSLAGAAPYAPRFVLLDDAFPKIDERTHPLLFGLLVDLDLDFVITSERLWGVHSTVPSLAIYEALRDPHERGIAQYRHVWDGRQLTAIGA